jgi:hypothetical protein
VSALLDDQHLGLDRSLDATGRADLEAAAAVDVALVVTIDDDVVRLDGAADTGLRADDQRSLALDLALRLPLDAQVAVAHVLAVEPGVRVDDALIAGIAAAAVRLVWRRRHVDLTAEIVWIQVADDVLAREGVRLLVTLRSEDHDWGSSSSTAATARARRRVCQLWLDSPGSWLLLAR